MINAVYVRVYTYAKTRHLWSRDAAVPEVQWHEYYHAVSLKIKLMLLSSRVNKIIRDLQYSKIENRMFIKQTLRAANSNCQKHSFHCFKAK